MRPIFALALNTYREVVRQRLFILVLAITAAVLVILLLFPYFTTDIGATTDASVSASETSMFKDLALNTAALALLFLVALTASSTIAEELESRTALAILAKPVARWQFLLGKYLGIVAALAVAAALLAAMLALATYLRTYVDAPLNQRQAAFGLALSEPAREFQALMRNQALTVLPGALLIFCQGALLAAVALVLSSRFSRVLAVLVTVALYLVGHLAEFITAAVASSAAPLRRGVHWSLALLPRLDLTDLSGKIAHSVLIPGQSDLAAVWLYAAQVSLYTLLYAALILLLGLLLFGRREIR